MPQKLTILEFSKIKIFIEECNVLPVLKVRRPKNDNCHDVETSWEMLTMAIDKMPIKEFVHVKILLSSENWTIKIDIHASVMAF